VEKDITGLHNMRSFMHAARNYLADIQPGSYAMAAIDIEHFRMINTFCGRDKGDELLIFIADCLKCYIKQHGGVAGRFNGDNFCIIMPFQLELFRAIWDEISLNMGQLNGIAHSFPAIGIYILEDLTLPPETMYDRATMALSYALGSHMNRIRVYEPGMENSLEKEWKVLSDVKTALENDEFTFYAQPQYDITTRKIVGAEALARWIHYGKLIPPGVFIPVLEKNRSITPLDKVVWTKVAEWLHNWIRKGYHPVPVSINISRLDILTIDVPEYLISLTDTYQVPRKYLKCEITESAYAEDGQKVNDTVTRLQQAGFQVMMDDFGSGYSSLNTLKSMDVDVLKIDMGFLEMSIEEEQKGIGILESVVNMARLLGIPIVLEGVENQQHENFMRNMGCRYAQGYYYSKPLPIHQLENLLADERNLDLNGMCVKQIEALHTREFIDGNLFTDTMVNNILGAAAFYDVYENKIEITRVNEQYFQLVGVGTGDAENYDKKLWDHVRDDDRPMLFSLFEQAYDKRPGCAEGYIHFIRIDGRVIWVFMKVFFLREKNGHKMFYCSLIDVTTFREKEMKTTWCRSEVTEFTDQEQDKLERYYGSIPCGFGLAKIITDSSGSPVDYEIIYINHEMAKTCGGDRKLLRHLILKAFQDDQKDLFTKAFQAAFNGETLTHYAYSSISSHYLQLTLYQHEYGYVACLMRDVTHMQIHEGALNSMVLAYREVYFLHLRDNYCRMIYPDANGLMERGNYAAVVNRHFGTGKILKYDEKNVRSFLSLDNLRAALMNQDSTEYRYRRSAKDSGIADEWCLTSVTVSEREKGIPITAVVTIRSIDNIIKEEEEKRHLRMAQSLANMSDGFFIYRAIDDERILYANPAIMTIFGCNTMEEFMELVNGSFRGLVHPDDFNRVEWEIQEQIRRSKENMDYVQYRITRKDGEVRWLDDCGHLENSEWGEEHRLFYVFVRDITDQITEIQKEKLLNSNQFYQKE
jgi:PAS domain S-box-containing protein